MTGLGTYRQDSFLKHFKKFNVLFLNSNSVDTHLRLDYIPETTHTFDPLR